LLRGRLVLKQIENIFPGIEGANVAVGIHPFTGLVHPSMNLGIS